MEDFVKEMVVVVIGCAIAFFNFMFGYDAGYGDGSVEGYKSIAKAHHKIIELENELRTCRIDRDILRRKYNDLKYNDLMRKIKAMEGVE